jgi:hypothetical protein
VALSGLNVLVETVSSNGSSTEMIAAAQGVWSQANGTTSAGPVEGSGTTNAVIACPVGERITGIYGYAIPTEINAIGIYCNNSNLTSLYQSQVAGGVSGNYFSLSCSPGHFATTMYGNVNGLLDELGLGCQ